MIQPNSSKKNDSEAKPGKSSVDKSKCYLVKGPKPLQKYRFYLDIKSHAVTSKLEQKIKDLGGVVEFFLVREVTHVVSDRQECAGSNAIISPQTPAGASVESSFPNESPKPQTSTPRAGHTRLKTRADAMLEKVRSQSVATVSDPLKNAKLWDIPIWTVNKVFSWLEKVSASITIRTGSSKSRATNETVKQFSIKAPFIKFEPVTRDARPVYKSLDCWPVLDFDAPAGKPAFCMKPREKSVELDVDTNDSGRMTRKSRARISVRGSLKDEEKPHTQEKISVGYCEICHLEYRELSEHLRSDTHQQFIRNEANFLTLDSLIGASANVEAFLRLNGGSPMKDGLRRSLRHCRSPNGKLNGMDEHCRSLRSKMYNTRYSSNYSALSPVGSDGGHHLRSRGHIWLPNNLFGTTADDEEICPSKPKESARQERKNSRLNDQDLKDTKENEKEVRNHRDTERSQRDHEKHKDSDRHSKISDKHRKDSEKHGKDIDKHSDRHCKDNDKHNKDSERHGKDNEKHKKDSEKHSKDSEKCKKDSEKSSKSAKENKSSHSDHNKNKKSTTKVKRISADERLVADNRTYYKVEVMPSKLRSSGITAREHELIKRSQTPIPEEDDDEEPSLVVKFKRIRRSELSVLNDEAENFMFPRRDDSSHGDLDTDDGPNTTCSTNKNESVDIPSSESETSKPPNDTSKSHETTFIVEPSEDSMEEYLDSIALKDRLKCEMEVMNKKKMKKEAETALKRESEPADEGLRSLKNCSRRDSKRKTTKKNEVLDESLDDTAQDGSVMGEILAKENKDVVKEKADKKKKKTEITESIDDTEISKDGTSRDSVALSVCDSEGRRKKRRTHAELFIEDNQKYFKFESPSSRLRYHGSIFSYNIRSPTRNNGEQEEEKLDEMPVEDKPEEFSLDNVKFSFEIEPRSEPWYQTFTRQDRGEEHYTSLSEPGYHTRLILPYQLPAHIIPLDPKICISHYEKIKNYLIDPDGTLQASTSANTDTTTDSSKPDIHPRRRKRKTRFLMKSNHPRKSPRQHASTLAILSGLIHPRKKREKRRERLEAAQQSLSVILEETISETPQATAQQERVEQGEAVPERAVDSLLTYQHVSEILSAPMDDIEPFEDIEGIVLKDKLDAIELIQNYNKSSPYRRGDQTPGLSESTRIVRRKRKKNRTGWPKKKRLFPRKPKNDKGVMLPDEEDSRLTGGSADDNNGGKDSDMECGGSDVENNRTIRDIHVNTNSVDSNGNVHDSERKCDVKQDGEVRKTKSEIEDMINDSSEDILVVYDKLKQGVPQCVIKNDKKLINRFTERMNSALVKGETENVTKENVETGRMDSKRMKSHSDENTYQENKDTYKNPNKKEQRNSSSDCSAEEVIPSAEEDNSVNVDLNTWENAEKVLHAKMADNEQVPAEKLLQYQPFVRVQKIDNKLANRRLRSSSSPDRKPKPKKAKTSHQVSPRSPRKLRAPRGKWYRER